MCDPQARGCILAERHLSSRTNPTFDGEAMSRSLARVHVCTRTRTHLCNSSTARTITVTTGLPFPCVDHLPFPCVCHSHALNARKTLFWVCAWPHQPIQNYRIGRHKGRPALVRGRVETSWFF
jgi:hypothetical protein